MNSLIFKAKPNYIKNQLHQNSRNPKKFWRIIKNMLSPNREDVISASFVHPRTGQQVESGGEANFLNDYFINIVQNLNIPENDYDMHNVYNVDCSFSFSENMPYVEEVIELIKAIDITKASCVENINAKICKEAMLGIPDVICQIMCKSLTMGKIPSPWTRGVINVIPKGGDLSNPGNWRPITQASIFAKILENIVHKRLLEYLLNNNIISKFQLVFWPGRSTQLAIFELLKQVFSSFNKKKLFGSICLDVSKAFDCINHVKLFEKVKLSGITDDVLEWFKSYFIRTQLVKYNDTVSDSLSVGTRIGQGTILGLLVFVFSINDVTMNIANLRINMYADDCLIYTIGNNWGNMFPKIQDGLDSFQNWCV